jgi:hypothetical protein
MRSMSHRIESLMDIKDPWKLSIDYFAVVPNHIL